MLNSKEQLADSQGVLELQGDLVKPGIYKVEVVQYDNDDTSGDMVTYRTVEYEVKEN